MSAAVSETYENPRNPGRSPGITPIESRHRGGTSPGPSLPGTLGGSEHPATTPPSSIMDSPRRRPGRPRKPLPTLPGPSRRRPTRKCRRESCGQQKPTREFVLLDDPKAQLWAIKDWCGGCLLERRHINLGQYRAYVAAWDHTVAVRERAAAVVRQGEVEKQAGLLLKRVALDGVFADAVLSAAREIVRERRDSAS